LDLIQGVLGMEVEIKKQRPGFTRSRRPTYCDLFLAAFTTNSFAFS